MRKNWARYSMRWNVSFWGMLSVAGILGIAGNPLRGWTLVGALVFTVVCLINLANGLSGKLVVTDKELLSRSWFRTRTVALRDISSLAEERWDGGMLSIGIAPKRIRILKVRLRRSNGKTIFFDHAFMSRKHLDQLVGEVRARAGREIKGYKPKLD